VIPRSRGGSDTISNYLLACQDCNNDKADQTVSEWLGIQGPPPFLIPREKVRGETAPGTAYIERMKEASDE
jgi:5-methylcytosine-specific restriction endonuclease McrA